MKYTTILIFSVLCIVCISIAGCSSHGQTTTQSLSGSPTYTTQSSSGSPTHTTQSSLGSPKHVVAVSAQNIGKNITITYQGGPDSDKLLYCIVTLNGIKNIEHLGNIPGSSLISIVAINPQSQNHIVITGVFTDGSSEKIFDTMI